MNVKDTAYIMRTVTVADMKGFITVAGKDIVNTEDKCHDIANHQRYQTKVISENMVIPLKAVKV
jgi:hypothetical protein